MSSSDTTIHRAVGTHCRRLTPKHVNTNSKAHWNFDLLNKDPIMDQMLLYATIGFEAIIQP